MFKRRHWVIRSSQAIQGLVIFTLELRLAVMCGYIAEGFCGTHRCGKKKFNVKEKVIKYFRTAQTQVYGLSLDFGALTLVQPVLVSHSIRISPQCTLGVKLHLAMNKESYENAPPKCCFPRYRHFLSCIQYLCRIMFLPEVRKMLMLLTRLEKLRNKN